MTFIDEVKTIYKAIVDRNIYDCNGKTALQIIDDFKIHIMEDVNSVLAYAVYTSSRFIFKDAISDEFVNELKAISDIQISQKVVINNNMMSLDFNSL